MVPVGDKGVIYAAWHPRLWEGPGLTSNGSGFETLPKLKCLQKLHVLNGGERVAERIGYRLFFFGKHVGGRRVDGVLV